MSPWSLLLIHCLQLYRVGVHPGASYSSTVSSFTGQVFIKEPPTHPLCPALQGMCSSWSLFLIHCIQLYRVGVHPGTSYSSAVSRSTGLYPVASCSSYLSSITGYVFIIEPLVLHFLSSTGYVLILETLNQPLSPTLQDRCLTWSFLFIHCLKL